MLTRSLIAAAAAALLALPAHTALAADDADPHAGHDHGSGTTAESDAAKSDKPAKKESRMSKMKECMGMMKGGKGGEAVTSRLEQRIRLLEKRMEVLEMTLRLMHDREDGADGGSADGPSR